MREEPTIFAIDIQNDRAVSVEVFADIQLTLVACMADRLHVRKGRMCWREDAFAIALLLQPRAHGRLRAGNQFRGSHKWRDDLNIEHR